MNFPNNLTLIFVVVFLLFAPAGLLGQTYQEMDAEAGAAAQRLWGGAFLDPIGKKVTAEFDAGNYAKTIEEANKFLAYAPEAHGGIQLIRGRAHLALYTSAGDHKHFAKARADFLFAIQNKPDDIWNYIHLGDLYFAAKRGFEADHEYSKALARDTGSLAALNDKAAAAYYARDFQGCINSIKGVMKHAEYNKQNDARHYLRLGQCYASLGDKSNAKQSFEKAVALQPGWKSSWVYMAFAKDGYTCKPAGRKSPENPFDRYVHFLRSYQCPGGGASSLFTVEKEDPNLRDDGLFHEREFQRQVNKSEYADSLTYEDAKSFYNDATFWLESARKQKKSIEMKAYNEYLELLNHAFNTNNGVTKTRLAEDFSVLARYERAKLLLSHPDKQIKILAWKEQAILSNIPNTQYTGKPVANNGADVKARVIRGRVYSEVKGNLRAAVAEFDSAINILKTVYRTTTLTIDPPHFAEPHWRKGDALAKLGEVDKAAAAYADSLQINPINPDATAGLERLRISPQVSANSAASAKVYEIEIAARINETAARANKAYSNFMASTGSGRTLKQKCDATSSFYSTLANERGKLVSLAGSIPHGTKLREHYTNTLNSIDNAMKLANSGLSAC